MTEEPYRWLEAIGNRREYIRDQFKGGTPVFAVSRPEGILMVGVGIGQSKVFEIYDRHAFGALGHPVDIEKLRQSAIEAAHMEGFNRSSNDVTLRRLISFALSTTRGLLLMSPPPPNRTRSVQPRSPPQPHAPTCLTTRPWPATRSPSPSCILRVGWVRWVVLALHLTGAGVLRAPSSIRRFFSAFSGKESGGMCAS